MNTLDPRIRALKNHVLHGAARSDRMAQQRREAFERVFRETPDRPYPVRVALSLAAFLQEKDLVVFEEDLLAGFQQWYDFTQPMELERFRGLTPDRAFDLDLCPYAIAAGLTEDGVNLMLDAHAAFQTGVFGSALGGHVIAGHERVLQLGFGKLIAAAEKRLRDASGDDAVFAESSFIACLAARDYALRYATEFERLAAQTTAEASQRLRSIAKRCRRISTQPPATFLEAVQLLWLTHEIVSAEQPSGSLSAGRLDQYLYPYFRRDIDTGTLTAREAEIAVQALWIKFGALEGAYQNVTLGGIGHDGQYAGNELTVMGLRATMLLRMDQPLLSFRYHESMPRNAWQPVLDLLSEGLGFPALFNDRIVIEAKTRVGLAPSDAADYGIVGCVEMTCPGREWSQTEAIRLNWAKVVELMLNDGKCALTGRQTVLKPRKPPDQLATFDEFLDEFEHVFVKAIDLGARATILRDKGFPLVSPYPFLSSTMAGCLETGKDVAGGGTTCNLLTMNCCGMADTVDSLVAIKHAVYERTSLTLPELADALRANFTEHESLRAELAGECRYGNDIDEPDLLMKRLSKLLHARLARHRGHRGGFQMGMYTVDAHAYLGRMTGALPSGRLAKASLANGLSPCQGRDTSGPTAVVKSLTKMDHCDYGNGMVLDLKFSPSLLEKPKGRQSLRDLVESYFQLGGLEIQFNIISRKTLLAARAEPDNYRDLIVRVSGFSAYFNNLSPECRDEIIARTEHRKV